MADINAVDLTAETLESLDGTENVVGFDTAEGKKIPISVLADYAIQKKTQTIAGSTQTPQAALNSAYNLKASITTAITDLNTFTTPGVYYFNNNGTLENNFPVVNSGELIVENRINSSSYLRQTFYPANYPGRQYVRDYNNGTWASWTLMPTRAEMDAVSTVQTVTFTPDTSVVSANNLFIRQVGKVVTINGYFALANANVDNIVIGTLPTGSRPGDTTRIPALVGAYAYSVGTPAYVSVGANGNVYVTSTHTSWKVIHLSASYVAQN